MNALPNFETEIFTFTLRFAAGEKVSFRRCGQPEEAPAALRKGEPITPIPELGAMAYNVQFFDAAVLVQDFKLKKPEIHEGVRYRWRAKVWRTRDRKPVKLVETWLASGLPPGYKDFASYVGAVRQEENRQLDAKLAKCVAPIEAHKGDGLPVDIRKTTRAALLELMQAQYPQTFLALKAGHDNEAVFVAYAVDRLALHGSLDTDTLAQLGGDKAFLRWLKLAVAKPGNVPRWKLRLALGWIAKSWHALDDDALAAMLNEWTGEARTPAAWRKAVQRIGLVSSRRPGAPELHPVLLPKE